MNTDELLIAQTEDRIRQCISWNAVTYSGFLDLYQQSLLHRRFDREETGCRLEYLGGYPEAERRVLFCVPEFFSPEDAGALAAVRVTHKRGASASGRGRSLNHRDYLGALLGLGIRRDLTGDILVREDGADILVLSEIAEYILSNFVKAGRSELYTERIAMEDLIIPQKVGRKISDTVASLRLDNVLAAVFSLSRGRAQEVVRQGMVFVNNVEAVKTDMLLAEGDRIVLRHSGKAVLTEIGGRSRKGRIRIGAERY